MRGKPNFCWGKNDGALQIYSTVNEARFFTWGSPIGYKNSRGPVSNEVVTQPCVVVQTMSGSLKLCHVFLRQ